MLGLVLAAEARTDEAIGQLHKAGQIAVDLGDLAEVAGAYVHLWRTLVEAGRGGDLVDLVGFLSPTRGEPSPSLMGSIAAAALHQLGAGTRPIACWGPARLGRGLPYGGGESAVTAVTRTCRAPWPWTVATMTWPASTLDTALAWCHRWWPAGSTGCCIVRLPSWPPGRSASTDADLRARLLAWGC